MTRDLTELEKEVQQHIVEILKDTVNDGKRIIKRLQATIVLLVILLAGTFVYYEWNFKNFVSQYDIESTVTQEFQTNEETKGTVNISDINKNNSIRK